VAPSLILGPAFHYLLKEVQKCQTRLRRGGSDIRRAGKVCCATQSFHKSPPKCKRFLRKAEPCRVAISPPRFAGGDSEAPLEPSFLPKQPQGHRKPHCCGLLSQPRTKGESTHPRNAKPATKGGSDIRPKPGESLIGKSTFLQSPEKSKRFPRKAELCRVEPPPPWWTTFTHGESHDQ
jgi:hypothetical protein